MTGMKQLKIELKEPVLPNQSERKKLNRELNFMMSEACLNSFLLRNDESQAKLT